MTHSRSISALVLGACALACSRDDPPTTPGAERASLPNVVVFTLDTTRADRLGCYGHAGARTPNLDRLARTGARFARAYAPVPLTLPSHATLFAGREPPELGVHDNGRTAVPASTPLLAELFRAAGARTGAFVSAQVLEPAFGLARGFDTYDCDVRAKDDQGREMPAQRRGDATADAAIAWLGEADSRPFFAWIHFYDPHSTYDPPSPWRELLADRYDGEIAFMDAQIGRVLAAIEARGALEKTIVVAVADHGESLGEHGEATHGLFVYDATQRVPLIVLGPDAQPRVVDTPVGLVDLAPTIAALAGLAPRREWSGRSLVPALRGEPLDERPIYAESEYGWLSFGWSPLRAVVRSRWKYIGSSRPELYDLGADPKEKQDRIANEAGAAEALAAELEKVRARFEPHPGEAATVDPDLARRLETLGYVQSGADEAAPADLSGLKHPRDMASVYEDFTTGVGFAQHGFPEKGIPLLERAARACPEAAAFHLQLGMAHHRANHVEDAAAALEKAVAIDPELEQAQYFLGLVENARERYEAAIARFDRSLALRPGAHNSLFAKSWTLLRLGRADDAIDALKQLVALRPDDGSYVLNLAQVLRSEGRSKEALAALRDHASRHPDEDGFALYLAWELATNPDPSLRDGKRAVELAERAVAREKRAAPDHLDTLAAAYAESGRFDEALATIDEALSKGSSSAEPALLEEWRARRALYAAKQPFRDR